MRDIERIDRFTFDLNYLWKEYLPDLRFWQIVCILQNQAKTMYPKIDVWELEERQWKNIIESLVNKRKINKN